MTSTACSGHLREHLGNSNARSRPRRDEAAKQRRPRPQQKSAPQRLRGHEERREKDDGELNPSDRLDDTVGREGAQQPAGRSDKEGLPEHKPHHLGGPKSEYL